MNHRIVSLNRPSRVTSRRIDGEMVRDGYDKQTLEQVLYTIDNTNMFDIYSVRPDLRTYEVCQAAVRNNIDNLDKIPDEYIDDELIIDCIYSGHTYLIGMLNGGTNELKGIWSDIIEHDPRNLVYIPLKNRTKDFLKSALYHVDIYKSVEAVKFLPKRYLNDADIDYILEIANEVCNVDRRVNFKIEENLPEQIITPELLSRCIVDYPSLVGLFPEEMFDENELLSALGESLDYLQLPHYLRTDRAFIEKALRVDLENIKHIPKDVIEVSDIEYVLSNGGMADLGFLDDETASGLESKYPDMTHHKGFVTKKADDNKTTMRLDTVNVVGTEIISDRGFDESVRGINIYYISDLHIDHKIDTSYIPFRLLYNSVRDIVSKLESQLHFNLVDKILVAGDISDDVVINELFLNMLGSTSISVMGNHELWNLKSSTFSEMVDEYRQNIRGIVLENELLVRFYGDEVLLSHDEFIALWNTGWFEKFREEIDYIIYGCMGFSPYNDRYNASSGIYRDKLTRDDEIALSEENQTFYDDLIEKLGEYNVIVLSHMPVWEWSKNITPSGWKYIHGHTHQNSVNFLDGGAISYGDAQIGYKNTHYELQLLTRVTFNNPFENFEDGRYYISRNEYRDFLFYKGINMNLKSDIGEIIMIKKSEYYMFFATKGRLALLDGGRRQIVEYDINYYEEHMMDYIHSVIQALNPFQNYLMMISKIVQSFGGLGKIHGSIVDVDFYRHIYVNPYEGTIHPYYAESMTSKDVYPSMELFLEGTPYYKKYIELARSDREILNVPMLDDNTIFVDDTEMYKPSLKIKKLQFILEKGIVRNWDSSLYEEPTNTYLHILKK